MNVLESVCLLVLVILGSINAAKRQPKSSAEMANMEIRQHLLNIHLQTFQPRLRNYRRPYEPTNYPAPYTSYGSPAMSTVNFRQNIPTAPASSVQHGDSSFADQNQKYYEKGKYNQQYLRLQGQQYSTAEAEGFADQYQENTAPEPQYTTLVNLHTNNPLDKKQHKINLPQTQPYFQLGENRTAPDPRVNQTCTDPTHQNMAKITNQSNKDSPKEFTAPLENRDNKVVKQINQFTVPTKKFLFTEQNQQKSSSFQVQREQNQAPYEQLTAPAANQQFTPVINQLYTEPVQQTAHVVQKPQLATPVQQFTVPAPNHQTKAFLPSLQNITPFQNQQLTVLPQQTTPPTQNHQFTALGVNQQQAAPVQQYAPSFAGEQIQANSQIQQFRSPDEHYTAETTNQHPVVHVFSPNQQIIAPSGNPQQFMSLTQYTSPSENQNTIPPQQYLVQSSPPTNINQLVMPPSQNQQVSAPPQHFMAPNPPYYTLQEQNHQLIPPIQNHYQFTNQQFPISSHQFTVPGPISQFPSPVFHSIPVPVTNHQYTNPFQFQQFSAPEQKPAPSPEIHPTTTTTTTASSILPSTTRAPISVQQQKPLDEAATAPIPHYASPASQSKQHPLPHITINPPQIFITNTYSPPGQLNSSPPVPYPLKTSYHPQIPPQESPLQEAYSNYSPLIIAYYSSPDSHTNNNFDTETIMSQLSKSDYRPLNSKPKKYSKSYSKSIDQYHTFDDYSDDSDCN